MKHLIITDARIAGHCLTGTSNKIWTACVAVEAEGRTDTVLAVNIAALPSTAEVVFLCGHGPYGAALRLEEPQKMSRTAAQKVLRTKWQEKAGKGYVSVAFDPFVLSFGNPYGLSLLTPEVTLSPTSTPVAITAERPVVFRHTAALLKAVSYEAMLDLLSDPFSAVSEKANGERCLVEFDGTTLRAYNRKGRMMSAPPEGARALCRLGHPFVVDGERLIREQAGHYVLFDVLEWAGESLLTVPYRTRMTHLVRSMHRAGFLLDASLTPTYRQACANSTVADICVLLASRSSDGALAIIEEVEATGGEGVVIRRLNAHYADTGFKYKFLDDIDAVVIGIEPGVAAGSLNLALLRPADRAVIAIGNVRSGLTNQDVEAVRVLLAQGHFPVFPITYLPASTIGITLVQPRTSLALLRQDKDPQDCTTDQFGAEKAELIAQATPVVGLTFS